MTLHTFLHRSFVVAQGSIVLRSIRTAAAASIAIAFVAWPAGMWGQEVQVADRGPRFLAAGGGGPIDESRVPALRRRVTLDLVRVRLDAALATISRQTGLHFALTGETGAAEQPVSLSATDISVGSALHELLLDTGLDVQLARNGTLTLVPRPGATAIAAKRRQGGGTIVGRVTDVVTRQPLDQVAVRVEGSKLGAVTTADGRYVIHNVPPGTYRVTGRRVGYTPLVQTIAITTDSTATADLALVAAPTRLNEMVTTAVGDQRRYEVGNVISTINADSIAPTAPITSLTDLISARAPGVEVLETSGMTGSGEAIRIRGLSSLVLQNDPILIIDGVRQDNSAGGDVGSYFGAFVAGGTHPTPTRLNDIDFTDIQSIDILKGPSASTEYGTDAANGVIVIRTKHGAAGKPQWQMSAEQTESQIPVHFPDGYYSWGHLTDGTNTAVNCRLFPVFGSPASTTKTCAVDSVTRWNPLNHAATSIFGTGNRGKYDLSVSGGSDAIRYFVTGGLSNETGPIRMPTVFKALANTAALGLPNAAFSPNNEQQRSVRVNTAIGLGTTADLTVTGSYVSAYQQTPSAQFLYFAVVTGPALADPAHYYGYDYFSLSSPYLTPISQLSDVGAQHTNRVTGGLAASWRPAGWFVGHSTVGLDHGSQQNEELNYPLANAAYELFSPSLGLARATTDVYSVDLRATATAVFLRGVRTVTSAGLQLVDTRTAGQSALAKGITATNLTLNGATGPTVAQFGNRQATLGGYGEEQVSLADRLFVTGALRIDAGSGFGRDYKTAAYPKASVSWLATATGRTTLRVRGAFGESGVQPTNGAAMTLYGPQIGYFGGGTVTTYTLSWPGNAHLRPERSTEFEGGIDLTGWGERLSVDLTGYAKTTHDALVNVSLGQSLGNYPYQENIGGVRNTGVEGAATVGIVHQRFVTWDVGVTASTNHNRLLSLAPGVVTQTVYANNVRQAAGYPLYGLWAPKVTYADTDHDGTVEPGNVTLADSATYVGPSLPTREASVSTHVGFWRGAVTVGALADYRGGDRMLNIAAVEADYAGNTRQMNDPAAPVWLRARAIENTAFNTNALDVEDGSFVRLREVSVTYMLPRSWARALRLQSATATGAVRNLALWTRYTGIDPEVSNTIGQNIQSVPTSGSNLVNNDVRLDYGAVPLLRYWVVRLNLGL